MMITGGRLFLSVWNGPSVYNRALGDAVERRVGADVANKVRAPRTGPDAEEVSSLVVEAGFREVGVRPIGMDLHFPLPEKYVPTHLAATPMSAEFAALDEDVQVALVNDVSTALQPYVQGNELVFPDSTNIATAFK